VKVFVQQRDDPGSRTLRVGILCLADNNGRNPIQGKAGKKFDLKDPLAKIDVASQQRVGLAPCEVRRRIWMTHQEFIVGSDQRYRKRSLTPTAPHAITEPLSDSKGFGQSNSISVRDPRRAFQGPANRGTGRGTTDRPVRTKTATLIVSLSVKAASERIVNIIGARSSRAPDKFFERFPPMAKRPQAQVLGDYATHRSVVRSGRKLFQPSRVTDSIGVSLILREIEGQPGKFEPACWAGVCHVIEPVRTTENYFLYPRGQIGSVGWNRSLIGHRADAGAAARELDDPAAEILAAGPNIQEVRMM
jgi:hypothetical protein